MASGIKVAEIMSKKVAIAHPEMTIERVARVLNKFRIGGLPVVEYGILVGMITERDIMKKVIALNKKPRATRVKEVMSIHPILGDMEMDIDNAAELMAKADVTRIPIVNNERKLVGIITNKDIISSSRERLDILLEQAKIKGVIDTEHSAFGRCELCGETGALVFKENRLVCDECISGKNKKFFRNWFR